MLADTTADFFGNPLVGPRLERQQPIPKCRGHSKLVNQRANEAATAATFWKAESDEYG
ncbi:MAG: hypothetical protein ACJAZO_000421 [Myxococcota bacterium]